VSETKNNLIVIIPAYEPQKEFIDYAKVVGDFAKLVVVINDGSSEDYNFIFDEISSLENVVYLRHEENKGKGCALKTAFKYCVENCDKEDIIVTADCDGQHASEDVINVYKEALNNTQCLILGSRNFKLANIPPKSQIGNTLFRRAFRFFYGLKVYDTQTGLRGFSVSLAEDFLLVRGERFEYEMSVLIFAKKNKIRIIETPIQTIYPDDPKDHVTHYRPIKDTLKIFNVVVKNIWVPKKKKKK